MSDLRMIPPDEARELERIGWEVDETAPQLVAAAPDLAHTAAVLGDLLRDVAVDWGDRCDHPEDCACSMARLVRTARALRVTE